jgi:hypothetical protein
MAMPNNMSGAIHLPTYPLNPEDKLHFLWGGNTKLRSFFASYSIPPDFSLAQKYSTSAARYYRERLRGQVEGRQIEIPKPGVEEGLKHETDLSEKARMMMQSVKDFFVRVFNTTTGLGSSIEQKFQREVGQNPKVVELEQAIQPKLEAMMHVGESAISAFSASILKAWRAFYNFSVQTATKSPKLTHRQIRHMRKLQREPKQVRASWSEHDYPEAPIHLFDRHHHIRKQAVHRLRKRAAKPSPELKAEIDAIDMPTSPLEIFSEAEYTIPRRVGKFPKVAKAPKGERRKWAEHDYPETPIHIFDRKPRRRRVAVKRLRKKGAKPPKWLKQEIDAIDMPTSPLGIFEEEVYMIPRAPPKNRVKVPKASKAERMKWAEIDYPTSPIRLYDLELYHETPPKMPSELMDEPSPIKLKSVSFNKIVAAGKNKLKNLSLRARKMQAMAGRDSSFGYGALINTRKKIENERALAGRKENIDPVVKKEETIYETVKGNDKKIVVEKTYTRGSGKIDVYRDVKYEPISITQGETREAYGTTQKRTPLREHIPGRRHRRGHESPESVSSPSYSSPSPRSPSEKRREVQMIQPKVQRLRDLAKKKLHSLSHEERAIAPDYTTEEVPARVRHKRGLKDKKEKLNRKTPERYEYIVTEPIHKPSKTHRLKEKAHQLTHPREKEYYETSESSYVSVSDESEYQRTRQPMHRVRSPERVHREYPGYVEVEPGVYYTKPEEYTTKPPRVRGEYETPEKHNYIEGKPRGDFRKVHTMGYESPTEYKGKHKKHEKRYESPEEYTAKHKKEKEYHEGEYTAKPKREKEYHEGEYTAKPKKEKGYHEGEYITKPKSEKGYHEGEYTAKPKREKGYHEGEYITKPKREKGYHEGEYTAKPKKEKGYHEGEYITKPKKKRGYHEGEYITKPKKEKGYHEGEYTAKPKKEKVYHEGEYITKPKKEKGYHEGEYTAKPKKEKGYHEGEYISKPKREKGYHEGEYTAKPKREKKVYAEGEYTTKPKKEEGHHEGEYITKPKREKGYHEGEYTAKPKREKKVYAEGEHSPTYEYVTKPKKQKKEVVQEYEEPTLKHKPKIISHDEALAVAESKGHKKRRHREAVSKSPETSSPTYRERTIPIEEPASHPQVIERVAQTKTSAPMTKHVAIEPVVQPTSTKIQSTEPQLSTLPSEEVIVSKPVEPKGTISSTEKPNIFTSKPESETVKRYYRPVQGKDDMLEEIVERRIIYREPLARALK